MERFSHYRAGPIDRIPVHIVGHLYSNSKPSAQLPRKKKAKPSAKLTASVLNKKKVTAAKASRKPLPKKVVLARKPKRQAKKKATIKKQRTNI